MVSRASAPRASSSTASTPAPGASTGGELPLPARRGTGQRTLTAATLDHNDIQRRINDLGPLATIPGIVLFGRVEGIRFTDGQPRNKIVLSADGELGDFGLTARTTRYGRVIAPGATAPLADPNSLTLLGPDDIILRPKWVTDLELRFRPIQQVEVAIGANNVFDVYPDRSPIGARPGGGQYPINQYYLPYSGFSRSASTGASSTPGSFRF